MGIPILLYPSKSPKYLSTASEFRTLDRTNLDLTFPNFRGSYLISGGGRVSLSAISNFVA